MPWFISFRQSHKMHTQTTYTVTHIHTDRQIRKLDSHTVDENRKLRNKGNFLTQTHTCPYSPVHSNTQIRAIFITLRTCTTLPTYSNNSCTQHKTKTDGTANLIHHEGGLYGSILHQTGLNQLTGESGAEGIHDLTRGRSHVQLKGDSRRGAIISGWAWLQGYTRKRTKDKRLRIGTGTEGCEGGSVCTALAVAAWASGTFSFHDCIYV